MKQYITSQVLLACLSVKAQKNNVYVQLESTIAERRRIMKQLEDFSIKAKLIEIYSATNKAA